MHSQDFDEFSRLLDDAYDLIGSGANKVISGGAKALFFNAMAPYSLDQFRAALSAHCLDKARGRFTPKPADIIEQIDGASANDGRPSADEAWAIALRSQDEADTVVWTAEIAEAFSLCSSVFPDEVGARMAFKDAYNRIVDRARQLRQPAAWTVSLGWDMSKREVVLQRATTAGLIAHEQVMQLLPNYTDGRQPQIEESPEGLRRLKEVMAQLRLKGIHEEEQQQDRATAERLKTAERKREIATQVQKHKVAV